VHYERFVDDPTRQGLLLEQLADVLGAGTASAAGAEGFVSGDMRHNRTGLKDAATEQALTGAQLALARWLAELPEGWAELHPPKKLRAQADGALVTAAEYYDAVADRYGMETAYDMERHRALHFEQATELKDRHIENIENALEHLRHQVDAQAERISELEAQNEGLRAGNDALSAELHKLHEDGRAAATNLLSVARRARPGRSGH
jgi:cell division protein FtsB